MLQAVAAAALAVTGLIAGVTPLRAAPSLQALQDALNSSDANALSAVLEPGEGLDPQQVERQRQLPAEAAAGGRAGEAGQMVAQARPLQQLEGLPLDRAQGR